MSCQAKDGGSHCTCHFEEKKPCKLGLGGPHVGEKEKAACCVAWAPNSGPKFGLQKGFNSNLHWAQIGLIILGSKIGPRLGV